MKREGTSIEDRRRRTLQTRRPKLIQGLILDPSTSHILQDESALRYTCEQERPGAAYKAEGTLYWRTPGRPTILSVTRGKGNCVMIKVVD
ncbi:MAG TPA: hypothetical protein VN794_00040, partial [Methylomirabilota bacterium]|nr:hypothetical protein [Methylomirabilota bacterium]